MEEEKEIKDIVNRLDRLEILIIKLLDIFSTGKWTKREEDAQAKPTDK